MSWILQRSMPEAEGISSVAVRRFARELRKLDSVHSFMIMRHGKVIAKGWKKPYGPDIPHMLFSLSKSFTSCAVGFAVAEGKLSLDSRLVDLFKDKLPKEVDPKFESMRIRHLLSMSSGHDHCTMDDMVGKPDWEKAFFATKLAYEPGTRFCYNSGATYMLAATVVHATGESLKKYLRPRLLDPLGIAPRYWELSPQGIEVGGWGFNLTTEEIASFAQCLLDGGKREEQQLIPPEYLALASSVQTDNSMNEFPDWNIGYGFQFWRGRHNTFRGDGAFGQCAVVMPDQDMAIAITAGLSNMQQEFDLIWDILLPAAGDTPLPPATTADSDAFRLELNAWAMPILSSAGAWLPRRSFTLKENALGFKTLEFASFDDRLELTLDGETLKAGYGKQMENTLNWREPVPRLMVASAKRISNQEYELLVCCCETPFQWHFALKVNDNGAELTRKANLLFRTQEWPTLIGKSSR
ncbi:MAG: beta-lactamase family protein [Victivallales bacterium]|jgi:CubicO group peptidase (beta-lactamase class C family)|nr:beta-lactamase family protein [Victivallales bacterium]